KPTRPGGRARVAASPRDGTSGSAAGHGISRPPAASTASAERTMTAMTAPLEKLVQALLVVPLTLLPIINPLGSAPIFMMTAGGDPSNVRRLARQVAINCWYVILGALFIGTYVLDLFRISLPIVRVGGGLLVAASAWRMLDRGDEDEVRAAVARGHAATLSPEQIVQRSFFPITFPLTTG